VVPDAVVVAAAVVIALVAAAVVVVALVAAAVVVALVVALVAAVRPAVANARESLNIFQSVSTDLRTRRTIDCGD
jgi:hypothetical protein